LSVPEVATVLGSIPASSDTVESEGRQIKQCWITYIKNIQKIPLQNYDWLRQAAPLHVQCDDDCILPNTFKSRKIIFFSEWEIWKKKNCFSSIFYIDAVRQFGVLCWFCACSASY
jgi:hypothetical protein